MKKRKLIKDCLNIKILIKENLKEKNNAQRTI
jgi:hypothetical protein